jgi:hypothetical protein
MFKEAEALQTMARAEQTLTQLPITSRTLRPLVRVLLARAKMLHELGKNKEAARALARVIVIAPDIKLDRAMFPPKIIKLLDKRRRRAEKGSLAIQSSIAGITVWIDGRRRGASPVTLSLPTGIHYVAVGEMGAARGSRVVVKKGQTVSIKLDPPTRKTDDTSLKAKARALGADWALIVKVVAKGGRFKLVVRALPTDPLRLPRSLSTSAYQKNQLGTAAAKLADKLAKRLKKQVRKDDKSQPFYKKWWFWTAVGAAVVGGTVTAVVLGTQQSSKSVQITVLP